MNYISFKLKDGHFYISKCELLKASRPAWEIYSQSKKSAKIIASVLRPSPPSVRRDRQPLSFARSAAVDIFGLWPEAAISLLLFLLLSQLRLPRSTPPSQSELVGGP